MVINNVGPLLDSIAKSGSSFLKQESGSRQHLLESARALISAVEVPSESVWRMAWCEPALYSIIRVAINLHFFDYLTAAGDKGLSTAELVKDTGAEEGLICNYRSWGACSVPPVRFNLKASSHDEAHERHARC